MANISRAERERRAALAQESGEAGSDEDDGDAQPERLVLVKMERDGMLADVHPLEVENYKLGNWRRVEE